MSHWTANELAVYRTGVCPHNMADEDGSSYDCGKCDDLTMQLAEKKTTSVEPCQDGMCGECDLCTEWLAYEEYMYEKQCEEQAEKFQNSL
jgi:hypothetical protein